MTVGCKASELVPCSLLPHWNSMRFFATVSLSDMNSLQEVKFAILYRQSSNTSRILYLVRLLCCDYVTYVPALEFPKSSLRTPGYRQKIHHFFFSQKWGTRFKYLSKLCPYILRYSALHIMQWFSQVLDVFTPKIKRTFFDFYILWIKTNVAYTRLEMIARTKYCTTTTASNWFVTLHYKLLPAVRSSSKHGRWRSSLLLYSISMVGCAEHEGRFPLAVWSLFADHRSLIDRQMPGKIITNTISSWRGRYFYLFFFAFPVTSSRSILLWKIDIYPLKMMIFRHQCLFHGFFGNNI